MFVACNTQSQLWFNGFAVFRGIVGTFPKFRRRVACPEHGRSVDARSTLLFSGLGCDTVDSISIEMSEKNAVRPRREKKPAGNSTFRTVMVFGTFIMLVAITADIFWNRTQGAEVTKSVHSGLSPAVESYGDSALKDEPLVEQALASTMQAGIEVRQKQLKRDSPTLLTRMCLFII